MIQDENKTCESRMVLTREFQSRMAAAEAFPPTLTDFRTRKAIRRFQDKIARIRDSKTDVCASSGLFICVGSSKLLHRTDRLFQESIHLNLFTESDLDCCAQNGDCFMFCQQCFNSISKSILPKFGSINIVNKTSYQQYPLQLTDLTPVEEAMIALARPVILILKLRPSGVSTAASYQRIRGHAVVLAPNAGPLLEMLPSSSLVLHDVIRIVWASKRPHTKADIKPFAKVRREKVLTALRWLKHDLIQQWEDEFIPTAISENALHCDPSHTEKQGYCADLDENSYEDDFQHAVDETGLDDSTTISGFLYTDTDQIREHPTSKFLAAVANKKLDIEGGIKCNSNRTKISNDITNSDANADAPLLTYHSIGRAVPLNDWKNWCSSASSSSSLPWLESSSASSFLSSSSPSSSSSSSSPSTFIQCTPTSSFITKMRKQKRFN